MQSERRLIEIASATRSTRSTSDDGVGGLRGDGRAARAHRDADVGERQRGRVVDPVADHHDRAQVRLRLERADDVELLLGRLLGVDAVDAEPLPDRLRDRSACRRSPSRRGGSRPRADAARAGRRPSGAGRRSAQRLPRRRRRRPAPSPSPSDIGGLAAPRPRGPQASDGSRREHRRPSTSPSMPRPNDSTTPLGTSSASPSASRAGDERLRQRMRRELVDAGGEPQRLLGGDPVRAARTRSSSGWPSVSVPVLSSSTDRALPSCSIVAAPLTTTPARAQRGEPRAERDRRGQDQRARRRDDEHGERAHRVARKGPGETGDHGRDRQEDRGVAIGDPDEGRALAAGLLDEPHERGVGALGGRPQRAQLERRAGAARPAAHLPAAADRDRQRLAGERRLVDHRLLALDHPVDRDDLARADDHTVAGNDDLHRHLDQLLARRRSAVRGARSTSAVSSRAARRFARSSSALPPASISATTAPARYSPSASAPAIETSAIASTPTSRRRSERTTEIVSGTSSSAVVAAQNASAADRAPAAHAAIPPTTPASAATATSSALRSAHPLDPAVTFATFDHRASSTASAKVSPTPAGRALRADGRVDEAPSPDTPLRTVRFHRAAVGAARHRELHRPEYGFPACPGAATTATLVLRLAAGAARSRQGMWRGARSTCRRSREAATERFPALGSRGRACLPIRRRGRGRGVRRL